MTPLDADTQRKRARFRQLHARGCFVLPNPWDVGSARYLQRQGFQALATTSAGSGSTSATTCWPPELITRAPGKARPSSSAVRRSPTVVARRRAEPH